MKGLQLENGTIKTYNSIPKNWGNIIGGFNTLSDTDLEKHGFYDILNPAITTHQELGSIEFDSENKVFTYAILDKVYSKEIAELKKDKIANLKVIYSNELIKTDWYVIRAQEGIPIPKAVTDARIALRSECASKETEINALSSKKKVVEFIFPSLPITE